jgi:hypothetical protein
VLNLSPLTDSFFHGFLSPMQDRSNSADASIFAYLSSPRLWALPTVLTVVLVIVAQFNYLGFHAIAEVFAIIVAAMLFSFAWLTFSYSKDGYSLILGCGYLFVGGLDLLHLSVFEGNSILVPGNINQAAEFWLAARGLEASFLLAAPFVIRAASRKYRLLMFTGCLFLVAVVSIFQGIIPDAYVEGSGLTAFKVVSEYIIVIMLLAAFWVTCFREEFLSKEQSVIIGSAILMTILGELCFTLFTSIEEVPFMVGHLLKIYSFWFIFSAVVIIGLDEPYVRLANSHKNFKAHYDSSPVSIWSEDFSDLLKEFDRLRRIGIEDFRSYLSENPREIDRLSGLIKVDDVNAATLELFEVDQDKDSLSRISLCFSEGARSIFANELCALWDGEASFQAKTTL